MNRQLMSNLQKLPPPHDLGGTVGAKVTQLALSLLPKLKEYSQEIIMPTYVIWRQENLFCLLLCYGSIVYMYVQGAVMFWTCVVQCDF